MCECNLGWKCREGDAYAYCGPYFSKGLPRQQVNPEQARNCRYFKCKE